MNITDKLLTSNIEEKEKELLHYYFGLNSNPEAFVKLLKNINVEDNRNFLLLVGQICYEQNTWNLVDERYRDRIKGLYRYYQLHNVILLKSLNKIVKAFDENKISCLLVKGGAMRLYYDKNVARLMSDIDVVVKREDFKKACKVLVDLGASTKGYALHSKTFLLDGAEIDLHRYIFKYYEEKDSGIYNRLIKTEVYGKPVYVLSNLDMFIHILVTQTYCFFAKERSNRHIKWLYDAYVLWRRLSDDDFKELPKRLEELHCLNSFYISFKLFESCYPDVKNKSLNIKPADNYDEWLSRNLKIIENFNAFNIERQQYSLNSYSFKTILLHFKYLIDYRMYQYTRLNSDNRFNINFIKYFIISFGMDDFSAFKCIVLKRFRIIEGAKDA